MQQKTKKINKNKNSLDKFSSFLIIIDKYFWIWSLAPCLGKVCTIFRRIHTVYVS